MLVASDRRYHFGVRPEEFWSVIADTAAYQTWWPWLRLFDGPALEVGAAWRCLVQPPLPYRVRFTLDLEQVEVPELVVVSARGDITGTARLEVSPNASGTHVRLLSHLRPSNRVLRGASYLAYPMVRFGHDWVLDTGARQFRNRAL
jgi:uncharacterized protein YndB with AHSA1/START domain